MYSRFNRRLCRPAVRWLSKTPITPNAVTLGGLVVAALSAYSFARGHWSAYVVGGALYFLSVLFDEMDGMLARITFRDSAFGCWLESFVDYASYILLYLGMTIGLYRQNGPLWLVLGGLILFGALTSFFVVSRQRKLATDPRRPEEYQIRFYRKLEEDSSNPISRSARLAQFLIKKAVLAHFVFLFSLLGALKLFFLLSTLGANLIWTLGLYFNRLFRTNQETRLRLAAVAGRVVAASHAKE